MTGEDELKIMKIEAEIASVGASRLDLLCKIKEREIDLERMKSHVVAQDKRIDELKTLVTKARGGN